jgi:hypothetical protein
MYIVLIMAGDGEIEMCVGPFETFDEAETIGKELYAAYDPTFDRLYVTGVEDLATARNDIKEMKEAEEQEQAEWNAANHPEGIIIETRMDK